MICLGFCRYTYCRIQYESKLWKDPFIFEEGVRMSKLSGNVCALRSKLCDPWFMMRTCKQQSQHPVNIKQSDNNCSRSFLLIWARGWIYAGALRHKGSLLMSGCAWISSSGFALLSAGDRRPWWPCSLTTASRGPSHRRALYLSDPDQPVMELVGVQVLLGWIQAAQGNQCASEGLRGGRLDIWTGLIRRPQQAVTDPSFTLWMCCRLTISSADVNCLISQLISDSKHRSLQQIPDGGKQWSS